MCESVISVRRLFTLRFFCAIAGMTPSNAAISMIDFLLMFVVNA